MSVLYVRNPSTGQLEPLEVGGSADAVLYTQQTLADEQKAQARANIDAAPRDIIPKHTAADNNKFLRVVNGAVAWSTVPSAEAEVF